MQRVVYDLRQRALVYLDNDTEMSMERDEHCSWNKTAETTAQIKCVVVQLGKQVFGQSRILQVIHLN